MLCIFYLCTFFIKKNKPVKKLTLCVCVCVSKGNISIK